MSTGKHQDHADLQLPLFSREVPATVEDASDGSVEARACTRAELRLVVNAAVKRSSMEDLSAVEARLISRARYF